MKIVIEIPKKILRLAEGVMMADADEDDEKVIEKAVESLKDETLDLPKGIAEKDEMTQMYLALAVSVIASKMIELE